MADFGKQQPKQEEKRPERISFVRKGPTGKLQMTRPKPKTGEQLETASEFRIGQYFNAVFSDQKDKEHKPGHECYECFHCLDLGYIRIPMETSDAKEYEFAFACHCNPTDSMASVMPLVQRGMHTLKCQMGETCKLPRKAPVCLKFNCPKFPKG